MTTIRNRHARRAARSTNTLRPSSLQRVRPSGVVQALPVPSMRPRRRPAVRRLPPLTSRSVRPLLRLVASNPSLPKPSVRTGPRHLSLVAAATPASMLAPVTQPFADDTPRAHTMIVLCLAAAGLVALATSIGRLLMT